MNKDAFMLDFDFEEESFETCRIKIEIYDNRDSQTIINGTISIESKKLNELNRLCKEHKCSLATLIELMLERISETEVENLLLSLSM